MACHASLAREEFDPRRAQEGPVEVAEYDRPRALQIRVGATATPDQLLRGLETVDDVIDEPTGLGDWRDTAEGRWRGLALRA